MLFFLKFAETKSHNLILPLFPGTKMCQHLMSNKLVRRLVMNNVDLSGSEKKQKILGSLDR